MSRPLIIDSFAGGGASEGFRAESDRSLSGLLGPILLGSLFLGLPNADRSRRVRVDRPNALRHGLMRSGHVRSLLAAILRRDRSLRERGCAQRSADQDGSTGALHHSRVLHVSNGRTASRAWFLMARPRLRFDGAHFARLHTLQRSRRMTPVKHSIGDSVCRCRSPLRLSKSCLNDEAQAFVQRAQAPVGNPGIWPSLSDQTEIFPDASHQLGRKLRDRSRSALLAGDDQGDDRLGQNNKSDVAHNLSVNQATIGHGGAFVRAFNVIVRRTCTDLCRYGSLLTSAVEQISLIPAQRLGLVRVGNRGAIPRPAGEARS